MTTTDNEPIYVKKTELAKLLGVSSRTIDTWVAKRMIPVMAISPRLHRYDVEAVKAALEERFKVPAAKDR
jgi:excisionase family DNA binding protein